MMALVKLAFLVVLVILVQARPQQQSKNETEINRKMTFIVDDGKTGEELLKLIAHLNMTGNFNKTSDQGVVSDFIANKVQLIQNQPEEVFFERYTKGSSLPLKLNMTWDAHLEVSGAHVSGPPKELWINLSVQVYAKNRTHHEALSQMNILSSLL